MTAPPPLALSREGCLQRQCRLRDVLHDQGLDAALVTDPRHIHYFSGYWCRPVFAAALLITRNDGTILAAPLPVDIPLAADRIEVFESNRLGTLVDLQVVNAINSLAPLLPRIDRLGSDGAFLPGYGTGELHDLRPEILALRRAKDPDEVDWLLRAIAATEAAYACAAETLAPGLEELELYTRLLAAAVRGAGEPIGELGNDFQIGGLGGPPRDHAAEAGEMAILDLAVPLRGYRSDMCRSFVVGRAPSSGQREAHAQVVHTLDILAAKLRPGVSCRELDAEARRLLENSQGWTFPHHLGHGIGLSPHEAPRLNPHWDDVLQAGDVITMEPGLYGPDLRVGVRVEDVWLITPGGARQLSTWTRAMFG